MAARVFSPLFVLAYAIIFVLDTVGGSSALAEARLPELKKGMSDYQVIRAWGPPLNKQNFESKREDLWRYGNAEVRFREGRVRSWSVLPDARETHEKVPEPRETPAAGETGAVEAILGEIMESGEGGQ